MKRVLVAAPPCRVLGTVSRSTGYVVWKIEIFAKGAETPTKVYSTPDAPNVAAHAVVHDFREARAIHGWRGSL